MQSIFESMTSLISGKTNEAQGNLATNLEVTKAEVLQAEEAERERRIKSYEFKECALANAKYVSNIMKAAGFPQPVYLRGTKKRTLIIEELERSRRIQNPEESGARRTVSNTIAGSINALGWPFVARSPVDHEPSEVRQEIDESLNRIASLVSLQALTDVKRSEEQERYRRETDVQGQQAAIGTASRVSLDVEGHMVDATTREERERERRRNSASETFAKSNANEVARLVLNYRQETLAQSQSLPDVVPEEQEALRRAGSKLISDMILDARRAFELTRVAAEPSRSDVLIGESSHQPETNIQGAHAASELVQIAASPVYVAPQQVQVVQLQPESTYVRPLLPEAVPTVAVDSAPSLEKKSSSMPKAVTFEQPTFARTYSTAGSMSPTIFPLRRSAPVASSEMRGSGDSLVTPHYNVVVVPDPVTPLDSTRRTFKAPELSRASSSNALTGLPQSFVAHPLSRSLSAHELSYMKKEATKHEKMSMKQSKKAEKLLHKSEKLKSKGKLEQAKKKEVKAFELRKEALKHEESANKNKFGTVVLTPAPPSM